MLAGWLAEGRGFCLLPGLAHRELRTRAGGELLGQDCGCRPVARSWERSGLPRAKQPCCQKGSRNGGPSLASAAPQVSGAEQGHFQRTQPWISHRTLGAMEVATTTQPSPCSP